jgi:hypothetical protein
LRLRVGRLHAEQQAREEPRKQQSRHDANGELLHALAGGIRHHPVQSHCRQQQRQPGEQFEPQQIQAPRRHRSVDPLGHGLHLIDEQGPLG